MLNMYVYTIPHMLNIGIYVTFVVVIHYKTLYLYNERTNKRHDEPQST